MLPIMIALNIGIGLLVLPELVFAEEYVVGDENGWNYDGDCYAWADGKTFLCWETYWVINCALTY